MYTTAGNLALNPRAGLLFIDFDTGDTLQITVRHLSDPRDTLRFWAGIECCDAGIP